MKQIGILTHYYKSRNIGGLLQAYALVELLNKHGYHAEQICFDQDFLDEKSRKIATKLRLQKITLVKLLKFILNKVKNYLRKYQNKKIAPLIKKQNKVFEEFENFIPHSNKKYNTANMQNANDIYEIFISGSDQVFASYLLPLFAYYGEFTTPDKKVISYAASSDVKKFYPNAEKLFIQKIQRFNNISVREKTLKDYIEKISSKKAELVLDPTLLLSKEDWLQIANPKIVPNKKYIFCYFLGSKSAWQRKIAQKYADKYGYEVVHLPYIMRNIRSADRYLKGQGRYDVGPREFISLINGAECIVTDSFHGMAFAINFNKNFYVFNRDDKTGEESMNARITDTLEIFGLSKRYINSKKTVLNNVKIDYTQVNKILEIKKQASIYWLSKALED